MPGLQKITSPFTDGMTALTTLPAHQMAYSWTDEKTGSVTPVMDAGTLYVRALKRSYTGEAGIGAKADNTSVKA